MLFCDTGVSGTTLARRGLDARRDRAGAGDLDRVVGLCPDRVARKPTPQLVLVEEFHRLGVEIECTHHLIAQTPEAQLLFHVQGGSAEFAQREDFGAESTGQSASGAERQSQCVSPSPLWIRVLSAR